MNKIKDTTKKIHEAIDAINQKYGLQLEFENGSKYCSEWTISSDTIRDILISLWDLNVLGENQKTISKIFKEYEISCGEDLFQVDSLQEDLPIIIDEIGSLIFGDTEWECPRSFQSYYESVHEAEMLCHKWLDGLCPMFDLNREKVLEELLEILNNFIYF
jgi:hypothetical protein